MTDGYEYAKANMLQSLRNAITYISYMRETDTEMSWQLQNAIEKFKRKIEKQLKEYEQHHKDQGPV